MRGSSARRRSANTTEPGKFVTFKGYEAGCLSAIATSFTCSDEIEPPLDAKRSIAFIPQVVFERLPRRGDAIIIPHHVKTWTDWAYHDPELEPLMEIYSCWGQSESPGPEAWNKGQTPGAGRGRRSAADIAWGMIASSDNHVGMPGRAFPATGRLILPFKGGLVCDLGAGADPRVAVQLTPATACYGTTGARIIVASPLPARRWAQRSNGTRLDADAD